MGQRTQLMVIKERENEKQVKFYHNQWGYGRVMYFACMDLLMREHLTNKPIFETSLSDSDFTEINMECLQKCDINDLSTIREAYSHADNNNGGLVIYIRYDEKNSVEEFKIGFLLGREDAEHTFNGKTYNEGAGKEFERWLTPQEYATMNGGSPYIRDGFMQMFDTFCKQFKVEQIQ